MVLRPVVEGVSTTWQSWAHRWETTSTLAPATRRHVHRCLLKAGRWLAAEHPMVDEPGAWTRELCAAYVAAIDRMRVGDYAQRCDPIQHLVGRPLSPRSKEAYLGALRQFFRDVQEWEWIPRRFDPTRALATRRSVKAFPPQPQRHLTAGGTERTTMDGIQSRHHTGSIWATPNGSPWVTVDTLGTDNMHADMIESGARSVAGAGGRDRQGMMRDRRYVTISGRIISCSSCSRM